MQQHGSPFNTDSTTKSVMGVIILQTPEAQSNQSIKNKIEKNMDTKQTEENIEVVFDGTYYQAFYGNVCWARESSANLAKQCAIARLKYANEKKSKQEEAK